MDIDPLGRNAIHAEALLIIASILSLGNNTNQQHQAQQQTQPMDPDSRDRLTLCLRILADASIPAAVKNVWVRDCHKSFSDMLRDQIKQKRSDDGKKPKIVTVQADDLIKVTEVIRVLKMIFTNSL